VIRVCYVVDPAFLGGAELYVSQLALALNRDEFLPSVMMRRTDHPGLRDWAGRLQASGVDVTVIDMDLPYRPAHAVSVVRKLESLAPHIVHVNMPGPYNGQNALLVPLARLAGARAVVTEHLPMVERTPRRGALKSIAYRWLDLAITVSDANAVFLRDRQGVPEARIRVVHNGIEDVPGAPGDRAALRGELGIPGAESVIWYVGNILEHKGLRTLVDALGSIERREWRLLVVGSGPDREEVERRVREYGLSQQVRFLGQLPPGDVRRLLPAGDMLALPSRWEGLPYVILEAMAAGLPVLSTPVYGIPEAVVQGETGLLTPPGDAGALAVSLETLLADPALRVRMGRGARARFEAMFTLRRQVASTSRIYRELVTGRPGR